MEQTLELFAIFGIAYAIGIVIGWVALNVKNRKEK